MHTVLLRWLFDGYSRCTVNWIYDRLALLRSQTRTRVMSHPEEKASFYDDHDVTVQFYKYMYSQLNRCSVSLMYTMYTTHDLVCMLNFVIYHLPGAGYSAGIRHQKCRVLGSCRIQTTGSVTPLLQIQQKTWNLAWWCGFTCFSKLEGALTTEMPWLA